MLKCSYAVILVLVGVQLVLVGVQLVNRKWVKKENLILFKIMSISMNLKICVKIVRIIKV
jgi:hypothetical protein